jgi:hypothetical protein
MLFDSLNGPNRRARQVTVTVMPPSHRLAILLALLAAAPAVHAGTLNFSPTADAAVKQKYPTTNYGTETTIQVSQQSGYEKHIFMKFSVSGIPSGASNLTAKVTMTSQTTISGTTIAAHACTNTSWTETGITWNNAPSYNSSNLSTVSSVTNGATATWNVSGEINGNGTWTVVFDTTNSGDITFGSRESSTPPSLQVTYDSGIGVSNGNLSLDGNLWIPKGLVIVGWVAPDAQISGEFKTAQQHWGSAELAAAGSGSGNWNADLIRFQVSVCGLDPQSSIYDPNYLTEVVSAVNQARAAGFKVDISMQHESPSGCPTDSGMPEADTERAWQQLVPQFATDGYIIFELYNEPDAPDKSMSPTAADWSLWQNGGTTDGNTYVGHQAVLNTIRTAEKNAGGVSHLCVAGGLRQSRTFGGAPLPPLTDSVTGELGYAVHTYFNGGSNNTSSQWDTHFGNFHGDGYAILGTEWNACSSQGDCRSTDPTDAANLISYMRGKDLGNTAWSFDLEGKLDIDWSWDPNNYSNYTCGASSDGGPGTLIENDYQSH